MNHADRSRRVRTYRPELTTLEERCVPAVLANLAAPYELNSILVRFNSANLPATFNANAVLPGVTLSNEIAPLLVPGLRQVTFNPTQYAVSTVLTAFGQQPGVAYAEPNYHYMPAVTPNDTRFNELWGMHNTGQSGGTNDADIDAPEAWNTWRGDGDFVIAVIDTGVDYNHPDLAANMWTNPDEIAGNGIDDDANGFIDDTRGWDFFSNDNNPMDGGSHGTHVAGTIGAVGNNGTGVSGVNWNIKIMPLRFIGPSTGTTAGAIGSLNYAVAKGVKVSNNSWGGGGFSSALSTALNNARTAGHIFVAAAGNQNNNNDVTPFYPATYPQNNIVAVAATDRNDNRAGFSSYGATTVDLGAPGVTILSTIPNGGYANFNGTSMASPHVAGAVALIWDLHPNLTYQEVIQRVLTNVDVIPSMTGRVATNGRLNLNRAAFNTLPSAFGDTYFATEDTPLSVPASGVLGNDTDLDRDPLTAVLATQANNGAVVLNANGSFTYTPAPNFAGTDTFTYLARDLAGSSSPVTVQILVAPVNDAPIAVDDSYVAPAGQITGILPPGVLSNDFDVDNPLNSLRVNLITPPTLGSLVLNIDGSFTYTAPPSYTTDSFQYQVTDGSLSSNIATVTLRGDLGTPPVAMPDNFLTMRNSPVSGNVLTNDTDADGDTLNAIKLTDPVNGTLVFNTDGTFTYTPNAGFFGTDQFGYQVNDGTQDGNRTTVSIQVDAEPVANPDNYKTGLNTPLLVAAPGVLANDSDDDGDPLTAQLVSSTSNGNLLFVADGSFTYFPNAGFTGTDSFTYRADDGLFPGNTTTVTIQVGNPPVAVPDFYTTNTLSLSVAAGRGVLINDSSPNNTPLAARLVSGPSVGTLTLLADGSFLFTAPAGFAGNATFDYVANDGTADSNVATVTITVSAPTGIPIAVDNAYTMAPNQFFGIGHPGILGNDTDPDGQPLTAFLVTGTSNGTLTFNSDGGFMYRPNINFIGVDSFTYFAFDGTNSSNIATVTITVGNVPTPPPTPKPNRRVVLSQETGGQFKIFSGETGNVFVSVQPYGNHTGSIRVATADFNMDNVLDVLVGPGPQAPGFGIGLPARVFDGNTGQVLPGILGNGFLPFGLTYRDGMQVATGDVTGDGRADIIIAADSDTVSPQVVAYNGANGAQLTGWLGGFSPYTAFGFGGVRVATGDVNGDGLADIITSNGLGLATIKVFNSAAPTQALAQIVQFNAYSTAPVPGGGAFVAAGDLDGDGLAEIVTGAAANAQAQVRVFNGTSGAFLRQFSPIGADPSDPARVAVGDINGDGRLDIVVGARSAGAPSRGRVYDGVLLQELAINPGNLVYGNNYSDALFVAAYNKIT